MNHYNPKLGAAILLTAVFWAAPFIPHAAAAANTLPSEVPKRRSHQLIDGFGMNIVMPRQPRMPWTKVWGPIADSGVKWGRIGFYENTSEQTSWDWVEQERGKYQVTADVDEAIRSLTDNGIDLQLALVWSNALYLKDPIKRPARSTPAGPKVGQDDEPPNPIFLPPETREQIDGFLGYTRFMVGRYKDRIKHWEFWNEANIGYWRPFPTTRPGKVEKAKWYGRVLGEVADTIHLADPSAKVIFGGVAGPDLLFTGNALRQCAAKVDIVAYHPYAGSRPFSGNHFPEEIDPTNGAALFRERLRAIPGVRNELEFWANEWNVRPVGPDSNESVQARYLTRFYIWHHAQNVKGFVWALHTATDVNEGNEFGIINGETYGPDAFKPRQALRAFEVTQALFGQTERDLLVFPTLLLPPQYNHGEARSYCFRDRVNGKRIYAYWLAIYSDPADNFTATQVDYQILDQDLKNPILIDVRTGSIAPLAWKDAEKRILSVPLRDSVMAIADTSYIDWKEVPDCPGSLSAEANGEEALLTWVTPQNATSIEIERSVNYGSWEPVTRLNGKTSSFTGRVLGTGHTTFRIRAENENGSSAWSNPAWIDRQ